MEPVSAYKNRHSRAFSEGDINLHTVYGISPLIDKVASLENLCHSIHSKVSQETKMIKHLSVRDSEGMDKSPYP
jgi:uncharacterized protein YjaG (DUF416 family)